MPFYVKRKYVLVVQLAHFWNLNRNDDNEFSVVERNVREVQFCVRHKWEGRQSESGNRRQKQEEAEEENK